MNSTFYNDAVREQQKWLKPQGYVNLVEKPNILIYDRHLNSLTKRQIELCPNEKIRYAQPYDIKKKKARRKTIFTKPEANHGPHY